MPELIRSHFGAGLGIMHATYLDLPPALLSSLRLASSGSSSGTLSCQPYQIRHCLSLWKEGLRCSRTCKESLRTELHIREMQAMIGLSANILSMIGMRRFRAAPTYATCRPLSPPKSLQSQHSSCHLFVEGSLKLSSQIRKRLPLHLEQVRATICVNEQVCVPKTAIVPPVLVKIPIAPTFCFVRVFCTPETRAPATVVTIVALTVRATASLGTYRRSSEAMVDNVVQTEARG